MAISRRKLGRSGIQVSALGLGTARMAGLGWQRDDRTVGCRQGQVDAATRAIHRALDLGIDFFDTADVYGAGHSERVLGQALAGRREANSSSTPASCGMWKRSGPWGRS